MTDLQVTAGPSSHGVAGLGRILAELRAVLSLWRARARDRAALARLDERELCDIGLSPSDARCEVDKPFWRA